MSFIFIIYYVLEKILHLESSYLKYHHEALVLISMLGGSKAGRVKSCDLRLDVKSHLNSLANCQLV